MAETSPLKRHREETLAEEETNKRQNTSSSSSSSSSNNDQILCLLDNSDELNQPHNDLTSFINALQQDISSDDRNGVLSGVSNVEDSSTSCLSSKEDDVDEENEKVMQHLLEASDDELGLPSKEFGESNYELRMKLVKIMFMEIVC
ncbi:hypothetical protein Bca4012_055038 [Brassica carinata]